ncbi:MAG TPA: protease complex subunit PrcB family protein [Flavobacterium sp.]
MKKLIVSLVIVFGLSACSLNTDGGTASCGSTTDVDFTGFPLNCNYSVKTAVDKPVAVVLNTQEKMDFYFIKHENTCSAPNPIIDFSKKFLVGIFSGAKPTGGYSIKIMSVVENSCEMVVNFYEKAPLPDEMVTEAVTYPSDFILIPKTDKPIYFNKVNQSPDTIIIGRFYGHCMGSDCLNFYQINDYNILGFLNVNYGNYDFSQYSYNALSKKGEYTLFLKSVPVEILNLKGQTKTYGNPDSHDQGGVYFELHQGINTTRIYLDNDNTTDQSSEILLFKKAIQDKILGFKTS